MYKVHSDEEASFMNILHSRRFLIIFSLLASIVFLIGWIILVKNENKIYKLDEKSVTLTNSSDYIYHLDNVTWQRDNISITKDYVTISGWLLKRGISVNKVTIRIVLKDMDTDEYYVVPTDVTERIDVTTSMNDENTYDYCGFSVKIPYWEELTSKDYEILALYGLNNDPNVLIPFNTTIKETAKQSNSGDEVTK